MYYISTVFRKTRLIRDIYTYNVRSFKIGATSPICAVNCSKQALRTFYMALCRSWGVPGPDTTGSSTPTGCPEELWTEFQKLLIRKCQTTGRAAWWPQWEFVLYKPGDLRNGVRCETGAIFFRHKECGAEYSTKNFSQTAEEEEEQVQ